MGEDVGKLGGVFRVTDGLQKDFGEARVIDTPLAESGIIGTAIGLALRGYRPICEIQFDGFVFPAFDQIVTQLAKMRYRSLGTVRLPITIRIPFGGGIGAVEHHSESPEALFAHTPGLRVVACGDPADAYTMIQQAAALRRSGACSSSPSAGTGRRTDVDIENGLAAALPMESARVLVPGTDVTVLCYGPMVRTCAEAAVAASSDGRSLEVDRPPLAGAARHRDDLRLGAQDRPVRGRARSRRTGGIGAEIAAQVTQECFYNLEAPVLRVGAYTTPYPPSRLEDHYLPDLDRVLDAVDRTFGY